MKTRPPHSARGSALLTVILLTTVLCTLIASILGLALAERRLNHRDALRLEARYAAEAAAEYGISQIRQKYASRSVIDVSPTGSDAHKTPPVSFWKGSNVATSTVEVIGGTPTNVTTRSDAQALTVEVRDNGIGIPRSEQRKVFDRLYRVPTGNVHYVKGFGLGLSYVKSVVERHGGTIRVESGPEGNDQGTGSRFIITIPFEHGEQHETAAVRG